MFDENGELKSDIALPERKIAENLRTSAEEEQQTNNMFVQYQAHLEKQKELSRLEENANQNLINKYLLQYQAQQGIAGSGVAQGLQLQQRDMSNNRLANIDNDYNQRGDDLFNKYIDINIKLDQQHTTSELQFATEKEQEKVLKQNTTLALISDEVSGMLTDGKSNDEIYNFLKKYEGELKGNTTYDFVLDKYKPKKEPKDFDNITNGTAKVDVATAKGGPATIMINTQAANVNELNKGLGSGKGGKQDEYYNVMKDAYYKGILEGQIVTFNLGAQGKNEYFLVKNGRLYGIMPPYSPELLKIWIPDGYQQVGGTVNKK